MLAMEAALAVRAKRVIDEHRGTPTDALLERAMVFEDDPSPAMLERTAEWLGIIDALVAAGFTPVEVLRVALGVDDDTHGVYRPDGGLLAHLLDIPEGHAIATQLCDQMLAVIERGEELDWEQHELALVARLAGDQPLPARYDRLFELSMDVRAMRAVLAAMPPERRERVVRAEAAIPAGPNVDVGQAAYYRADRLLWLVDLAPYARPLVDELVAVAKRRAKRGSFLAADVAKIEAELAGAPARVLAVRPTPSAREARAYWETKRGAAKRAGDIDAIARDAYSRRIAVPAPELASMGTWAAASAARRRQIAGAIARAVGALTKQKCTVAIAGLVATFAIGKRRFCLVPGGTVELGFSEEEEAAVRAEAEVSADADNHAEQYEQLLEVVDTMRPLQRVCVGPLLVERGPGTCFAPDAASDALAASPFRVLSEAEWEWCARGGRPRELTYRGDVVPDHPAWFEETRALAARGANAFGLWGFGYEPELCADAWFESLDDIPLDGTPRPGPGERVVRGGAAQLYPWQATGEWHMLLSAFRMPASVWEYTIALRFALGIDCRATAAR